jgi:transcriptional regulator with XRE-family HTH domain
MTHIEVQNITASWHYSAKPMPYTKLTTTEAVGKNLKRLMEAYKLTQPQLAKKAGVAQRTISNILNATNEPGIEKINKIARVFGLQGWQLQMPNLPEGMLTDGVVTRVIDALARATPEGRQMIERLAEREAHYSKQNPEK